MAKLPQGYDSWCQLYDYLISQGVRYHTVRIQHMIGNQVTTRKLTLRTVERNAWREIEAYRLNENETYQVKCAVFGSHQLQSGIAKVERFLNVMQKRHINL